MGQENEETGKSVAQLEAELAAARAELERERKVHALEVENLKLRETLARKESATPILDRILEGGDRYLSLLSEVEARAAEQEKRARPEPEPPEQGQ